MIPLIQFRYWYSILSIQKNRLHCILDTVVSKKQIVRICQADIALPLFFWIYVLYFQSSQNP